MSFFGKSSKLKVEEARNDISLARYDHAKEGRLSEKEFYNVVALQHKVHCTLKEVPRATKQTFRPFLPSIGLCLGGHRFGHKLGHLVNQPLTNGLLFCKTNEFSEKFRKRG